MQRLITIASLLLFSSLALAAPIYTWVDAQGVTHFESQPPKDQTAESFNSATFQPQQTEKSAAQLATDAEQASAKIQAQVEQDVRKQVADQAVALKAYCADVRYNLAQLENNPRVLAQVDGKPTRLSEEARQARISEMKRAILEHCITAQ